ncbi:N-6 DNA methylase (plasmid) [Roseomonas mucosa]|uniref:N-6 DNA methylase n=1 Tax=Roseomonas mucosa TaxID=207340 RepID=UPI0030CAC127
MTGLLPYSSSESGGVALAIARARHRAICVVPPSFLFKATRADQHFKEVVAREFGLETIVGLPRGVYPNASIMAALLLFDLDRGRPTETGQVLVVDAVDRDHTNAAALPTNELPQLLRKRKVGDISVMASIDELAANDFNLSPDRYVVAPEVLRLRQLAEDAETVALGDLVEIYRPQALAGSKAAAEGDIVAFEIGVSDIDEVGLVETPGKRLALSEAAASQARKAVIEPGDALLVIKGSVGKVGYIRSIPKGALWLASQSFAVLRLRRHAPISDPRVLFRFLSSGLGQASLQNFRGIHGPQPADGRCPRLPIILPDSDAHAAIARQVDELFAIQDHIRQLRSDLRARQTAIWPDGSASSSACTDETKGNQHSV